MKYRLLFAYINCVCRLDNQLLDFMKMCSKSLIILLLGCALALANPNNRNGNLSPQPENTADIGSWLNDAHYEIRKSFKQTVRPFAQIYDALVEASNVQKYRKDKIEELRFLFHEIIDKSRENLSDIENVVVTNTIVNLQRAVEFLSRRPSGNGIVHGSNKNIQTGQHVPHIGNNNLQEIIGDQANNANKVGHSVWSAFSGVGQTANNMGQKVQGMVSNQVENVKDNLDGGFYYEPGKLSISDKLGGRVYGTHRSNVENTKENAKETQATVDEDAGFFGNLGNSVQRAADTGVENVKTNWNKWGNNWATSLKTGEGFLNNLEDNANKAFNNGKNTIGNGMENVKDNLNQWANKGFGVAEGFNNIGDQAKDSFSNGFNGVQNQFNQFVPWNNDHGRVPKDSGHIFDSRQTLEDIGKQLAKAIAVQLSEVEENLYKWKNLVDRFLSNSPNSERNVEQQSQGINEGINIPGSIGYMPSIDEGIEVPKHPIDGIFGKIGQNVGGNMGSGIDKFTGGFMPSFGEGREASKNPNDGTFGKIGQNVGGNMGSGVDKFTGAVGGFFNNAGKLFGL